MIEIGLVSLEILFTVLALIFCSIAVYAWDEVYTITKKGQIAGGWIYLIAATIFLVIGIYPTIVSFFWNIDPDTARYWSLSCRAMEGIFLMVAAAKFYNIIYGSLKVRPRAISQVRRAEQAEKVEKVDKAEHGNHQSNADGVDTEMLLQSVLERLSLYWGPEVSRQMLFAAIEGKVSTQDRLRIVAKYLPVTDEEQWKRDWVE